ncbi:MAG TPA: GHKL domain-containing protein, partial [Draconibacterium sp.]|nr:GHKL domain-containing protein [Draconibacterium sp.]
YSENLKLNVNLPKETGQMKIAPLIILPFIENAFKHGVSHFPGVAFVNLSIQLMGKNLVLIIENSKDQTSQYKNGKGIGLKNVQKRLDLMYPGKYILSIDDRSETFSVNLTLELEE